MNDQLSFSFDENDALAGFRLNRAEVYNWGTFHQKVWTISPEGKNALLTGDIGSGKSTIVDAITTLLFPSHRIVYNKAAGADTKERSLRSYVNGYYKTERNDGGVGAKPVALRDQSSFSVILGVFANTGYHQTVTLAQVFWQKDPSAQPNRFFVVADCELTIARHFSGFGSDIKDLKKKIKAIPRVEGVYDSFPPYAASFRRRFGIENEQALELFHQTVSMKSVGNLTDFVRMHMLEPFDVESRIAALISHFDDLNRAHEAVLKAKSQVQKLTPIVNDLDKHHKTLEHCQNYRVLRDSLRSYFARLKSQLLEKRLKSLTDDHVRLNGNIEQTKGTITQKQGERDELKQAIADNGGDRLERLKGEINGLGSDKEKRLQAFNQYNTLAEQLSFENALSLEAFLTNRQYISKAMDSNEEQEAHLENSRREEDVQMARLREEHSKVTEEVESLRKRRSNIDSHQIRIRDELCKALGISEQEIPFAGELLQVRAEDSEWEGAIERVLHNFAMSLLVPDRLYKDVSSWVDSTDLKGRLVYYRTVSKQTKSAADLHPDSMVRKLSVKPDSEFYSWLETQLVRRFDFVCCSSLEQFRKEKQALTVSGQIKGTANRHEKDDRFTLHDRSRYVLGWDNKAKLKALEEQILSLEKEIQGCAVTISDLQSKLKQLRIRSENLVRLDSFSSFEEIDWKPLSVRIVELEQERKELESASDVLKTLNIKLEQLNRDLKESESQLDSFKDARSKNEEKQSNAKELLEQCREIIRGEINRLEDSRIEQLNAVRDKVLGTHTLRVESCDIRQQEIREHLQGKIDSEEKKLRTLSEKIIRAMQDYRRDNIAETADIDATIESGSEFRTMLAQLEADDLPKFEHRFKELLNENTIREIANFQSQLNRERQEIRERIERINQSLTAIEYNKGRYIVLEAQENTDAEVRDFRMALRACTEGSLTGSETDQYAESKFLQVKAIIDRFRGREGSSDMDKRWTQKVTDVRNWFSFAASERYMEDHSEYEHYTDSGGKSGGQKEKLAYTVLAASLAYQFGLEWGEIRSRSFRFVVIDEAFGRGSDESARFGLELFKRLNLQLLIVTPLQKIHIIEPYVSSVGFVYSPEGRESMLRNLTIEEYVAEKEANAL
ncbi:ATP-binding protein [Chitinispirillales bacterium ANBcel5]|uniref:ATP-binding protein n=1 Tax=Cellulosispirillum alkaliphilum TaxID=3039283 RepID=UPI002A551872|nr:ATP-binding protein [Chitinispirillales bacterium ANBcel5]